MMSISSSLLEILACPYCVTHPDVNSDSSGKGKLELVGSEDAPSGLKCTKCNREYDIKETGVPNLLIEEAKVNNA